MASSVIHLTPHDERADGDGSLPDYPKGDDAAAEDYASYTRALWDEQEDHLRPLHMSWTQNLLFLSGRQWWRPNPQGTFAPPRVPEWKQMPVSNLSLAYFRHTLAKVTKVRPAWQVVPASSDPEDIHAAQLGEDVLEAKWMELKIARQIRRAVAWTLATGNCFLLPYWNTDTGKPQPLYLDREVPKLNELGEQIGTETQQVPAGPDGEPLLDPETGQYALDAEPALVDQGDIGLRVFSPFQVRVNPEAEDDSEVTWQIVAEALSLREIRANPRWKDRLENLVAEDVGTLEDFDNLMSGFVGGSDTQLHSGADTRDTDLPKALVLHYYERPCEEYPDGRYWVSAGQGCLLEDPQPLPDGLWPSLIHMTDIQMPGRYYAMANLEAVIGLNREYNEHNGQIKEHQNLMLKGKWKAEKGSGIKRGMLTNAPGEVLVVNPGFSVDQIDMKPLPNAVYQERERIMGDFEIVSGLHKVSMGKAPPGVTAGVAFLQLQEADDSDLGPFLAMLEETVAALAGSFLKIIQENYLEERLIRIAGPDRRYLTRSFKGADLEGAVDVVPIAESSFPWSKTARQDMLLQMVKQIPALFLDPETQQFDTGKFARLLPLGGLESLTSNEDLDTQEALREEEMFEGFGTESQEVPQVEFWQDHEVHYRQHVRVLKSARFKDWHPQVQQMFQQHVLQHDQARAQARMMGTTSVAGQGMIQQQQMQQQQQAMMQQEQEAGQQAEDGMRQDAQHQDQMGLEMMKLAAAQQPPADDLDPGMDQPVI